MNHLKTRLSNLESTYQQALLISSAPTTINELEVSLNSLQSVINLFNVLGKVHPSDQTRELCTEKFNSLSSVRNETYYRREIYDLYLQLNEQLQTDTEADDDDRYYAKQKMLELSNRGLALPAEELLEFQRLDKIITELSTEYNNNLKSAERKENLLALESELGGLPADFIREIPRNSSGQLLLTPSPSLYYPIMEECTNSNTRKRMFELMQNVGYPQNDLLLTQILQARDQQAQ